MHLKAFGPILEPAFKDNTIARIHLTAALNQISRDDCEAGVQTLKKVHPLCQEDTDHAAFLFFLGVAMERMGESERARDLYILSNAKNHRFYMPYMKVARCAQNDFVFEAAEENYRKAIDCLPSDIIGSDAQLIQAAASARSNLGSCLTMMHRLDEAEAMLNEAERMQPDKADFAAHRAILHAVKGDCLHRDEQLCILEQSGSKLLEQTKSFTDSILSGTHPFFSALPSKRELIAPFWQWFIRAEDELIQLLKNKEAEKFLSLLTEKLQPVFPFMDRELAFGVLFDKDFTHFDVDMADFFYVSLYKGFEELLAACPDALKKRWTFKIAH